MLKPNRAANALLRQPQLHADCLDINVSGHMNPIALLRLTLGVCDRLLETSADAVACPAHDFLLLYVSTKSLVNPRKLFRSSCDRSARSFFANAVRMNSGRFAL